MKDHAVCQVPAAHQAVHIGEGLDLSIAIAESVVAIAGSIWHFAERKNI
jgi:hypothetical protein